MLAGRTHRPRGLRGHRRLQGGRGLPAPGRRRRPRRPGDDPGRHPLRGRTTFSALASEPVQTSLWDEPSRSRTPAWARAPTWSWCARPPPGSSAPTPPASPHDLLTATLLATRAPVRGLPGHAHRDVGAPGRAGQPGHAAPPGRARGRARPTAAWPAATWAPAGWPSPADIVAARRGRCSAAGRPRRACGSWSPPAAPGSRSTRCGSSPTARRASRATPSPPRPPARGAKVTLVTTVDRPGPAGVEVVAVATRRRDGGRRHAPRRRPRRHRHGRRRRRLPPGGGRRPQAQEGRRRRPELRARADPRHPGRPRPGQAAPARCWSASPPRPRTSLANARGKLERKSLDLIVANDVVGARRRLRARHQRR